MNLNSPPLAWYTFCMWFWGCPAGGGEHWQCLAGFSHGCPSRGRSSHPVLCCSWLSQSGFPGGKPGAGSRWCGSSAPCSVEPLASWWLLLALAFLLPFCACWPSNCQALASCAGATNKQEPWSAWTSPPPRSWYPEVFINNFLKLLIIADVTCGTCCYTACNMNFIF